MFFLWQSCATTSVVCRWLIVRENELSEFCTDCTVDVRIFPISAGGQQVTQCNRWGSVLLFGVLVSYWEGDGCKYLPKYLHPMYLHPVACTMCDVPEAVLRRVRSEQMIESIKKRLLRLWEPPFEDAEAADSYVLVLVCTWVLPSEVRSSGLFAISASERKHTESVPSSRTAINTTYTLSAYALLKQNSVHLRGTTVQYEVPSARKLARRAQLL